ncbi:exodeoxyribonuclease III Xth [Xylanimonas cellulosilytica DSM 15894]|uniref:Exodeoxyribonuclease III Xth n=1 Tax=Xylanimonas cellulosilytica (strain DSM 15894 / JCM 12276 / CECT 5975 / KCTC 9989 / LMG 20990 / NBRC 107835 / XIL07) TaxID=446471 RepID=D1C0F3_XYLCX|nr:exodeoxyribonuclease III [Xylanimonas cellulosilytica]ACZ32156.1 exodeoxyribonuclease III Xth [Xylanimonas cellulosilytica DSM 15894]
MRLATWNVNSIRARVDRAVAFLERWDVDVLAIQETKCRDDQFPHAAFEAAGYEVAHVGFSQWNGVAIVSRVGIDDVELAFPGQPGFSKPTPPVAEPTPVVEPVETTPPPVVEPVETTLFDLGDVVSTGSTTGTGAVPGDAPDAVHEARALGATCGGVRVWSLYIPNGRAVGDPHYAYKLAWLEALRTQAAGWLTADPAAQVALVGDWNVIPLDTDVYDPTAFIGSTHVTPAERAAFAAFADAGYREVSREHLPAERTYTYWDYKQLAFPKNNGMRIDFTWATPALADRVTAVTIDREERKGKGASDHVPVILDLTD